MLYLDRLRRKPNCWRTFPRIKVWNNAEVNKAEEEDRHPSGDFGKLGVSIHMLGLLAYLLLFFFLFFLV